MHYSKLDINVIDLSPSAPAWTPDVIPANAGIQTFKVFWTPAFAGVTVWGIEFSSS
jgi:hypothetical protein